MWSGFNKRLSIVILNLILILILILARKLNVMEGYPHRCWFLHIIFALGKSWAEAAKAKGGESGSVYSKIAGITVITWFCYPIVWVFAEGFGNFSVTFEVSRISVQLHRCGVLAHAECWLLVVIVLLWCTKSRHERSAHALLHAQLHAQSNLDPLQSASCFQCP